MSTSATIQKIAHLERLAAIGFRGIKSLLGLKGTGINTADAIIAGIEQIIDIVAGGADKQRIAVEDEIAKLVSSLQRNDADADAALADKFDVDEDEDDVASEIS